VILMLKSLGINDLIDFDFMDPPPTDTIVRAVEQLYALGALNNAGELTKIGRQMAEFPTNPMLAKAILAAEKYGCVSEVLSIVPIQKAITAGFFPNAARLQKGGDSYRKVKNGQSVYLHPSSVLMEINPKWVIYYELVLTSKEYMRSNMPLKPESLTEVAPHFY